jgi:hypothetical protein
MLVATCRAHPEDSLHPVAAPDYDDDTILRLQTEIESMFVVDATYPHFIQQPIPSRPTTDIAPTTTSGSDTTVSAGQPTADASTSQPNGTVEWLRKQAAHIWSTRTPSSGIIFYRQILAYDPFHIPAARALAVTLLSSGDEAEAFAIWQQTFRMRHALPLPGTSIDDMIASIPIRNSTNTVLGVVVPHRLRHDIEQLTYLKHRRLPSPLITPIIERYEIALRNLTNFDPPPQQSDALLAPKEIWSLLAETYNRALYVPHLARVTGSTLSQRTINNAAKITAAYYSSTPHIFAVDELLGHSALHRLLQWAHEATVWYESYPTYVGVSLSMGLASDLILQLANDLRTVLPDIFCDLYLVQSWAFKYDDELLQAINVHADDAAVNFNLWLTPSEANADRTSGGLIVYHAKPPSNWNFMDFNGRDRHDAATSAHDDSDNEDNDPIAQFLDSPSNRDINGYRRNSTYVYQQNRAVFFESSLFHASDKIKFRRGYTNRRINLTLLFGRKGQTCRHHYDARLRRDAATTASSASAPITGQGRRDEL